MFCGHVLYFSLIDNDSKILTASEISIFCVNFSGIFHMSVHAFASIHTFIHMLVLRDEPGDNAVMPSVYFFQLVFQ